MDQVAPGPDGPATAEEPARALMWFRVSRDSGLTYGAPVAVLTTDALAPLGMSAWPPCQCPQHRGR